MIQPDLTKSERRPRFPKSSPPKPPPPKKPRPKKYWSRNSPDGPWDAIIIGSGMGGMTTAAMLAKLGKRVLVLEQHYVPGGFTHAFPRKGYIWDVGVHAIGEVTHHSSAGRILASLTGGELEWSSLGSVYEEFYFPGDVRVDFPDSPEQFRANLIEAFPEEEKAIDEYLLLIREVAGAMKGFHFSRALPRGLVPAAQFLMARKAQSYFDLTAREAVERLTDNPKLQTLFTAQWGYYGLPPSRASFALQALVVKHYLHGAFYPVGGSPEIARCLLKTVADAGGWTRILADVEEILIEKGRAVGVKLVDGEEIRAKKVVSAASAMTTLCGLVPEQHRKAKWTRKAKTLKSGAAHLCLYLGFKGDIHRAGASGANKWFWNTWDCEQESWPLADATVSGLPPVLYCSFPSLKDPAYDPGPEERHTGEVVTFVRWADFSAWRDTARGQRGEEYEAFKAKIEESLLEQYLERMPELRPMLDYVELSTPLSTDHFCRPYGGSIYGLEPSPERFRNDLLRPRSPIRNLYLSGSDVATGGVMGAMLGGMLGAVAAEPMASMRFLNKV